jgi:hypothetical protein
MITRRSTFFGQEAPAAYNEEARGDTGNFGTGAISPESLFQ